MKKLFASIIAATAMIATPALAGQTGGTGMGIGGTIGANYSSSNSSDFHLDGANDINGSSGSGFQADLSGSAANGGLSIAAFGGVGLAGTHTDITSNGTSATVNSISGSAGLFGGAAYGQNASFDASTMNFGQSQGRMGYDYSLDVSSSQDFNAWGELGGNFGTWSFDGF